MDAAEIAAAICQDTDPDDGWTHLGEPVTRHPVAVWARMSHGPRP